MAGSEILERARRRAAAALETPFSRDERAELATRMRVDGKSWSEIVSELGYVSEQAAMHAARRYGGFDPLLVPGTCKVCGAEVERRGRKGRLPESCGPEHRRELARRRDRLRRAEQPPRLCVDCQAVLDPEWSVRCPDCAERRRLERERKRERKSARVKAKTRHKIARGYTSAHWRRVRAEAIALAGSCAECGATENLTGHLPQGDDHRRAEVADVIVLCRSCHGKRRDRPRSAPPEDARRRRP